MFRFTIRDMLWLTVVVGLAVALILTHRQASVARMAWQDELSRNELIAELNQLTEINFVGVQLGDVAKYVSEKHEIPVVLGSGVTGPAPVSCKIVNVPLRSALDELLAPLDLEFRVKDGAILIEPKNRH